MCILSNQNKNLTIQATEELFSSALCYPHIYKLEILFNWTKTLVCNYLAWPCTMSVSTVTVNFTTFHSVSVNIGSTLWLSWITKTQRLVDVFDQFGRCTDESLGVTWGCFWGCCGTGSGLNRARKEGLNHSLAFFADVLVDFILFFDFIYLFLGVWLDFSYIRSP